MGSFTQKMKPQYGIQTYEDVRKTYEWIIKAIQQLGLSDNVTEEFMFYIGEILCHVNSFEEFRDNAYGMHDFRLVSFHVYIWKNSDLIGDISTCLDMLLVSANSKVMLENLTSLLNSTSLDEKEQKNNMYIQNHYNNIGVIVTGDNNIVANDSSIVNHIDDKQPSCVDKSTQNDMGKDKNSSESYQNVEVVAKGNDNIIANNNSSITIDPNKKESKVKQQITALGQNISSNIVWSILTKFITAIKSFLN